MSWHLISAADVQPQAWRNGGGQTRELLAWPHSTDWVLRISVADISADGPFSSFEGVDRCFAVLQGEGVRLGLGLVSGLDSGLGGEQDRTEMRVGDPLLHFDGALAPSCQLLGGPGQATRDFNLMHRRGRGQLRVQAASQDLRPQARWVGLFSTEGGHLLQGDKVALPLAPLSLAWCERPVAQPCRFEGSGAAWWMSWNENSLA